MNKKRLALGVVALIVTIGIWSKVEGLSNRKHDVPASTPTASPEASAPAAEPQNAFVVANLPDKNVSAGKDGVAVVTNADSTLVLANKKRNLPSDYAPADLVVPNVDFSFSGDSPKKQMRKVAADALESLFAAAKADGIDLKAVSGYRSYATQKSLFAYYINQHGQEAAERFSAHPGQSEHQTGLAMDVSSASVGYGLEESYGKTAEGQWLVAHAAEHGFIIRYPQGKEAITGYSYEPWHLRYVGVDVAKRIMEENTTLEEYFDEVAVLANAAGDAGEAK